MLTDTTPPEAMENDALVSAFRVPATLTSLAFVRGAVALVLDRDVWDGDTAARMLLAASEAVSNAIEHGSPTKGGEVEVRVAVTPSEATLTVTDEGRPGEAAAIDLDAPTPDPYSTRGRGILIIRTLADMVLVEPAGTGNRVTMVFNLHRSDNGAGEVASAA